MPLLSDPGRGSSADTLNLQSQGLDEVMHPSLFSCISCFLTSIFVEIYFHVELWEDGEFVLTIT